ncbi:family pseudouridylate synthase protein [Rutstroemia sp. NJR-2017a WRK4]|nr:family pseudouridylate synthase protein [Rutstroemia sp. NJR-2017a WRK4]
MSPGKVLEGVFAIHKPTGLSSAQVLRDLQTHFNPSALFAPWIKAETAARDRENHNQRQKRRKSNQKVQVKIGHGGTLDPLATGVLIAGIGKGTKALGNFLECTKTYEAVVLFGAATDTYDVHGKLLKRAPYEHITRDMLEKGLAKYKGKFMQLPPLFSALKMNGKPLYEYAREGKEIPKAIERREVTVSELELLEWYEGGSHSWKAPTEEAGYAEVNVATKLWKQENANPASHTPDEENERALEDFETRKRKMGDDQDELVVERPASKQKKVKSAAENEQDAMMSGGLAEKEETTPEQDKPIPSKEDSGKKGPPAARIRMTVTSGFYVRSLCHDLGTDMGSAALMAELVRTRQGQFELGKNVLEYDTLKEGEDVWGPQVEKMLDEWSVDKLPISGTGVKSDAKEEPKVVASEAAKEVEKEETKPESKSVTSEAAEASEESKEVTEEKIAA